MKRIAPLLLALLLLLPACGRAQPEPPAGPTTQSPSPAPMRGESNGARWRTVDLTDTANVELAEALSRRENAGEPSEYQMGDKKIVLVTDAPKYQIEMTDATGKRTVLLERTYYGEAKTPEAALEDEMYWKSPVFKQALDDRYFLVVWGGYEWEVGCGIYDTELLREIPVEYPKDAAAACAGVYNETLYLSDWFYDGNAGQMHLYAASLNNLNTAKALVPGKNLLEGIPEADTGGGRYYWELLSPDARYFVAGEGAALRIFDLQTKQFVCRISDIAVGQSAPISFLALFTDERTAYCYGVDWGWDERPQNIIEPYALEITLP